MSDDQPIGSSPVSPVSSRTTLVPVSILVAAVLISGSIIYAVGTKNGGPAAPSAPETRNAASLLTALPQDTVLGDAKAPVTVIEYGDYQCPFCGKFFEDVEPVIRDKYVKTGNIKLIFRNFEFLGPESNAAGVAAECARDQGQFWGYHDALYRVEIADGHENNGNLNRALFVKLARELKMDEKTFVACLESGKKESIVAEETAGGREAGVDATPTTFVNGVNIRGLAPNDTRVVQAIETALKGQRN